MIQKNIFLPLIVLILFAAFLRFYNLNWGAPYYFHPDERNIASAVTQLQFPEQMNPHFFAYGSFPIYFVYIIGVIYNFIAQSTLQHLPESGILTTQVNFPQAIVVSRFISAVLSILLIPILYLVGKKLKNKFAGILAAIFVSTSIGFTQFAHYGTFEMWLTFFSVILFWICLKIFNKKNYIYIILAGIVFGIITATKVSHLVLLPLPILILLFNNFKGLFNKSITDKLMDHNELKPGSAAAQRIVETDQTELYLTEIKDGEIQQNRHPARAFFNHRSLFNRANKINLALLRFIKQTILFLTITYIVYLITNPYVLLDYQSFAGSMRYESGVVLGTLPVFYTGEFKNSIPVIFQFIHIYPFILNPVITFVFTASFIYLFIKSVKIRNYQFMLLILCFLILFVSQALLYAKWSRYMIPTLPFVYLTCAIALADLWKFLSKKNQIHIYKYMLFGFVILTSVIFAISYFKTAFIDEDTRIAARNYAKLNIPADSKILTEVYDLGITPFNDSFTNIKLFDFYDLDNNSYQTTPFTLANEIENSEYIILPSQRIIKTRIQDPLNYPNGNAFYRDLINGLSGFEKIYETPCDLFCRITYLNSPVYSFEETINVFDRPTVYIFKKIKINNI